MALYPSGASGDLIRSLSSEGTDLITCIAADAGKSAVVSGHCKGEIVVWDAVNWKNGFTLLRY